VLRSSRYFDVVHEISAASARHTPDHHPPR
jgi:hypothetical protein